MKTNFNIPYFTNYELPNINNFSLLANYNTNKGKTSPGLYRYLFKFWNTVMMPLPKDQVVVVLFRIRLTDGSCKTLSTLSRLIKSKKFLSEYFISLNNNIATKSNDYQTMEVKSLIFSYHIITNNMVTLKDGRKVTITPKIKDMSNTSRNVPHFSFAGYNLHVTSDFTKWGMVLANTSSIVTVQKRSKGLNLRYIINKYNDRNEVSVMSGKVLQYKFTDIFGSDFMSFTRIIGNHEYVIRDGKIIFKKLVRKVQFIDPIAKDSKINTKFLTLDIETRVIGYLFKPYCISIYDGNIAKSFYLSDYKDEDDMLIDCLSSVLIRKYNHYKIYAHNFSNFDGIFLTRLLSNMPKTKLNPLINQSKLIDLNVSFYPADDSKKPYVFDFIDSKLILNSSLRDLAKAFKVEAKGMFPYRFVNNPKISLDYKGKTPRLGLFENLSLDKYKLLDNIAKKAGGWSLRDETIKYCEQDARTLWFVLKEFSQIIFAQYSLNMTMYPTLPSLAFGIFRSHYIKKNKIPKIGGQIYTDIKQGYTGGHTDVYKPYGKNIFCYDINSLYPYVMKECPMPVGTPKFFQGDILEVDPNAFGFFFAEVIAPANMDRPLLQTKIKTTHGFRTVAPLGNWTDMIFSEELKLYRKYGYTFKVLSGYTFEQEVIFKDYIDDLYSIKKAHGKDDTMYLISKLLMNSLYGRFGMSNNLPSHSVVSKEEMNSLMAGDKDIIEVIDLKNGKLLVSLATSPYDMSSLNDESKNISIPIAAAISAYARMHMSQYLVDPKYVIYYTDTDSIFIGSPLPDSHVGSEIGQMKLEYIFEEAIFIAPKVYGGIIKDANGKELSKIKGFKNENYEADNNKSYIVKFEDIKNLLIKDNKLTLKQDKWFKSLGSGNITLAENVKYILEATESKRQFILDNNKQLVNTKPYIINNDKEIIIK